MEQKYRKQRLSELNKRLDVTGENGLTAVGADLEEVLEVMQEEVGV